LFDAIKEFLTREVEDTSGSREDDIRLACAALLIEVAVIDQAFDDSEINTLHEILQREFKLSPSECEKLTQLAKQERSDATSVHQFTRLVHENCSPEEKYELIKGMWAIAYADGNLDKYEEYIIRKVAELIYVSHSDFIRAKLEVRPA